MGQEEALRQACEQPDLRLWDCGASDTWLSRA